MEFKGGIDINGKWERATPDNYEAYVEGTGSIEGAIGASMFFLNPKVTQVEVEGSTSVETVCTADREAREPTLVAELRWTGLKALVTIQGPWDIFEFKHEFKVADEEEITTFKFNLVTRKLE